MQINSIHNQTFGQIFVSKQMKDRIIKTLDAMPEETRPNRDTFIRNWNRCLNTTPFDILIQNDKKVFLMGKNGQRALEEKLLNSFIWNIDTALKRVLLFEDAESFEHQKITKYS